MESPPSIELPPPQGLIPVPPGPSSLFLSPPSVDVEVQWMPVNSQSKPRSELLPAAGWTPAESTLEERIRQACQKTADVLAVIPHGPHKLTVRFLARSESHARVAADEVVRLPELQGYEISFEAKFRDP
jgi:hypothetical protein